MAKGEFDMLYLCAGAGGGGPWYFPLINQHLLRGGQKKNPEMIGGGGFTKIKGKNKEGGAGVYKKPKNCSKNYPKPKNHDRFRLKP